MKKVLVALVCTFGAVACGESRPAESPATTTSVTTETTTTRTPANAGVTSTAASTTSPRTTTASPPDGLETARPVHDAVPASATGATGATSANASSSDNAGVADHTKDATNTKINDRDRHGALTPMDQGGGGDRDITAAIRRAVVGDKALSFTAKNVKIITVGGKVTLRGPVKSEDEKSSIEAKAKATTGVADVDNQLEVKK